MLCKSAKFNVLRLLHKLTTRRAVLTPRTDQHQSLFQRVTIQY